MKTNPWLTVAICGLMLILSGLGFLELMRQQVVAAHPVQHFEAGAASWTDCDTDMECYELNGCGGYADPCEVTR